MFHKPRGCITARRDPRHATVMDYFPEEKRNLLFPVGRLDKDTEGFLLVTDDGNLCFELMKPENEIPKTYLVKTEKPIKDEDLRKLRSGVVIDGVKTNKCNVRLIETYKTGAKLHVTITEGRNRQVRKMFEAVNNSVDFLKRIKIGDLTLSGLNRGEVRSLTVEEIEYLKNL